MRKSGFFPRLALVNLMRNGRFYGPYLLTCAVTAAMYYILQFLSRSEGLDDARGAMYLRIFANMGCFVAAVFSAILLLYANSFVMKRRQRELGLYNILGLEKRHIARMCFWETAFCAAASILGGLAAGVLFSKLVLLILLRLARFPVRFGFSVSWTGAAYTAELFAVLFALTLAKNLWSVGRARPVELLRSGEAGEREPKTKWLLVILGVLTLGGGYALALTVGNPFDALVWFFAAVLLVIAGTYCLFTAGSIAALKRLRANPGFYYQTRHFTAVSGLLYRMKQNAVGLASICILSTMVLVTVSTTLAIYVGLEEVLEEMFPYDVEFIQDLDRRPGDSMAYLRRVTEAAAFSGPVSEPQYYTRYYVYGGVRENEIALSPDQDCVRTPIELVAMEDYARVTGKNVILAPDEVLVCQENLEEFPADFTVSVRFGGEGLPFHIRDAVAETIPHGGTDLITSEEAKLFLVAADRAALDRIAALAPERLTRQFRVQLNLGTPEEKKLEQTEAIVSALGRREEGVSYISRQDNARDFYAMYGGFLFLGVFLGILFLLATVLIIYYKQISEGYEDQRRYLILRQVGMSGREISASIHSQILLVFFLPLGAAALHVLMAFPMLSKMLELFRIYNSKPFVLCTGGTLAVFCLIYALVFLLTARTYSRVVGTSSTSLAPPAGAPLT